MEPYYMRLPESEARNLLTMSEFPIGGSDRIFVVDPVAHFSAEVKRHQMLTGVIYVGETAEARAQVDATLPRHGKVVDALRRIVHGNTEPEVLIGIDYVPLHGRLPEHP